MEKVLVIQRILTPYRVPFFKVLSENLRKHQIKLNLFYGADSTNGRDLQSIPNATEWCVKKPTTSIRIFHISLEMQQISPVHLSGCRLIIMEQANSLLFNFIVFALKPFFGYKIAYWGHGYNRQPRREKSFSEILKQRFLHWPDWWFAYTDDTTRYLLSRGFPNKRITTINNTIDMEKFASDLNSVTPSEIQDFRQANGIAGVNIGLYCGSLYADKKIEFLLLAAQRVRKQIPDFELIIAGDGVEAEIVQKCADKFPWIHYLGARFGRDKALLFKIAKLQLIPGAIGLAVVDSIASGTPLITTDCGRHGPEIEYLRDGYNGHITSMNIEAFAKTVTHLFNNEEELGELSSNCLQQAGDFTLWNMVDRFSSGIRSCLQSGRK